MTATSCVCHTLWIRNVLNKFKVPQVLKDTKIMWIINQQLNLQSTQFIIIEQVYKHKILFLFTSA